jgi:uncharacterized membrane protein
MSFESAKKMGFTASIIELVVPIVSIALVIAFYALLFSSFLSSFSGGSTLPSSVWFASVFPFIFIPIAAVSLVGLILFLIAMNRLSQYYNEKAIFRNPLNALIIQIISAVVAMIVVFIVIFTSIGSLTASSTSTPTTSFFWNFIGLFAIVIIAMFIVSIYCGLLYKRAFDKLAEKSGIDSFRTAGILYLIGSILGNLIVWIAWIFIALGFKKLTPTQRAPQQAPYTTYQPSPESQAVITKRCPTCGVENSPDSLYCAQCGRQL